MRLRTLVAGSAVAIILGAASLATHVPASAAPAAPAVAGGYHKVVPSRVLDTRDGTGAPQGKIGPDGTVSFTVLGTPGVPGTGVSAVVFNLTAVGPTGNTYITAYPSGTQRPVVSSLNVPPGMTRANLVTVPVGADGKVTLYNNVGTVDLLADVAGYFDTDGSAGGFLPTVPDRIFDSRDDGFPLESNSIYDFRVDYGADNDHITALALNITSIYPQDPGFIVAWDGAGDPPLASNLNLLPGDIVPNSATVPVRLADVNNDGIIDLTFALGIGSTGDVHVAMDVVGFYTDGSYESDLRYQPVTPTRVLDTRSQLGGMSRFGTAQTQSGVVPDALGTVDTAMFTGNLTVVDPTKPTYLTLWPMDAMKPPTSNVNANGGQNAANFAYVPFDYSLYNNDGSADAVIDVAGRFQINEPPAAAGLKSSTTSRLDSAISRQGTAVSRR